MKMKIIGLCGRSGSGKGYVCGIFDEYGIPSVDTDALYRNLTKAGDSPAELTKLISNEFGETVIAKDFSLNRRVLSGIVFSDPEKLALLNKITHTYIIAESRRKLAELDGDGAYAAILDAPLLFESGFNTECDITACVISDEERRVRRIVRRDGISADAAEKGSVHRSQTTNLFLFAIFLY